MRRSHKFPYLRVETNHPLEDINPIHTQSSHSKPMRRVSQTDPFIRGYLIPPNESAENFTELQILSTVRRFR